MGVVLNLTVTKQLNSISNDKVMTLVYDSYKYFKILSQLSLIHI